MNELTQFTKREISTIKKFYEIKAKFDVLEKEKKEQMLEYMRTNNIWSMENDDIKVTYVKPFTRKSVDTEKLKKDGIYEDYTKETQIKDSVRIEVKW